MNSIIGSAYDVPKAHTVKYAKGDYPVLFVGETGSGKELFARLYMSNNKRSGKKEPVNCAAFSDGLLRSEIFGHKKGSFSGAVADRDGMLRACKNGILFLDELGDASAEFQAAILRVSEGNGFSPVGSDDVDTKTDTLIIAATSRPHKVREDLKQRFHVLPIPPLQKSDIPLLCKHFLGKKTVRQDIIDDLIAQDYRGNIRELKKCCEKYLVGQGKAIYGKSEYIPQLGNFDYERYENELELWDKYIEPLVAKEKFDLKYAYIDKPRRKDFSSGIEMVAPSVFIQVFYRLRRTGTYDLKILDTNEPRGALAENIRHYLYTKVLFSLLGEVEGKIRASEEAESCNEATPDLSPLFDLLGLPLKEAEEKFQNFFIDYHLQIHSSKDDAANALGMTKKSLEQRIRRNKKEC
ncbi:MAG: sigma 54-interacting transcriptional regulator [Syntrophus sp. (in: bacteria)]